MSIGEAAVLQITGAYGSHAGHLDDPTLKRLSRFMMALLYPSLMLSLFESYDVDRLARWSPILLVALAHVSIGASLGAVSARLLRIPPPLSQFLVVSCAFGNVAALPFVLIVPAVENWSVTRSLAHPKEDALGIVGLYLGCWCICFFGVGLPYLKAAASASNGSTTVAAAAAAESASGDMPTPVPPATSFGRQRPSYLQPRRLLLLVADRNLVCTLVAIGIGCTRPLRDMLSTGGLRWLAGGWELLGRSGVVISSVVLGAALQKAMAAELTAHRHARASATRGDSGRPCGGVGVDEVDAGAIRTVQLSAITEAPYTTVGEGMTSGMGAGGSNGDAPPSGRVVQAAQVRQVQVDLDCEAGEKGRKSRGGSHGPERGGGPRTGPPPRRDSPS